MASESLRGVHLAALRNAVAEAPNAAGLDAVIAELGRRTSASAAELLGVATRRRAAYRAHETRRALKAAPAALPQPSAAVVPITRSRQRPQSLIAFLVKAGGIRDDGGDVRAMLGGTYRTRPGLVSGRGLSLDRAAMLALEAGFFPQHEQHMRGAVLCEGARGAAREGGSAAETMTPAVLLDAMDAELRGRRLYRGGEIAAQEHDADRDAAEGAAMDRAQAEAWRELRVIASERGWLGAHDFLVSRGVITPDAEEIPF